MTSPRAIKKMTNGTMGGLARVATPLGYPPEPVPLSTTPLGGTVIWDPIVQVVATAGSPNVDVIDGIFKAAFGPGASTGTWTYSDVTTGTWSNTRPRAWAFSMTITWADEFNQVGTRTVRVISHPSESIQDFTIAAGTNLDSGGNTVSIHSGNLAVGSTGFSLELRIDGTGSGTHMGLRLGRPRQFLITPP